MWPLGVTERSFPLNRLHVRGNSFTVLSSHPFPPEVNLSSLRAEELSRNKWDSRHLSHPPWAGYQCAHPRPLLLLCAVSLHREQGSDRRPLSLQGMSWACCFSWTASPQRIVALSKFKHDSVDKLCFSEKHAVSLSLIGNWTISELNSYLNWVPQWSPAKK